MVLPDVCTNVAECTKLSREKAAIAEELEELYENGKSWPDGQLFLPVDPALHLSVYNSSFRRFSSN